MRIPIGVDKTLDVRGLNYPRPKVITMNTLENMEQGQVLMVITDDRGTRESLPSLCSTCGYRLLEVEEDKGTIYFIIQR